jgi:thiosulfate dehydrogenase [quinone] large subunit
MELYKSLAGNAVVDWLFMLGLLLIGLALILGVGVKIAGYSGALMMLLMYTAGFILPEHNPILDEHIIYALLLILFTFSNSTYYLSLGKWWNKTNLVKKYKFLE